jgi:hypothetical protein
MGCSSSISMKGFVPKNIGGRIIQSREITEEEKEKIKEDRIKNLEEALLLLRKAGFPVDFCTDDGKIKVITEEWEVAHVDGKLSFIIEGQDIGSHFLNISTSLGQTSFPHVATGWLKPPGVQ